MTSRWRVRRRDPTSPRCHRRHQSQIRLTYCVIDTTTTSTTRHRQPSRCPGVDIFSSQSTLSTALSASPSTQLYSTRTTSSSDGLSLHGIDRRRLQLSHRRRRHPSYGFGLPSTSSLASTTPSDAMRTEWQALVQPHVTVVVLSCQRPHDMYCCVMPTISSPTTSSASLYCRG